MNFRKLTIIMMMIFIVGLLVPGMALAKSKEVSEKEAKEKAAKHISEFLSDRDKSISALKKTAKAPVIDTEEYTLSNGDKVKKEFRIFKVDDNLTIENTRTYTISATMYTVEDSYGLFWGGVPGAGGYMVAVYKYTHPTIDSPNLMTTQFYGASGHVENLDTTNYRFVNEEGTWDTDESYNPSAQVVFEMEMRISGTTYWQDITYKNVCEFNRYGEASFDWF